MSNTESGADGTLAGRNEKRKYIWALSIAFGMLFISLWVSGFLLFNVGGFGGPPVSGNETTTAVGTFTAETTAAGGTFTAGTATPGTITGGMGETTTEEEVPGGNGDAEGDVPVNIHLLAGIVLFVVLIAVVASFLRRREAPDSGNQKANPYTEIVVLVSTIVMILVVLSPESLNIVLTQLGPEWTISAGALEHFDPEVRNMMGILLVLTFMTTAIGIVWR